MSLGIPRVPYYDTNEDFEDQEFYYDSSAETEDPELRAFRARKEEDDDDFQDSLDFEDCRNLQRYQDHFYKGWAEEYYSGKYKSWEDEEREIEEEWVELPTLFFESGSLFIFGIINNEMANNIISSILLLNEEKENIEELSFFINSPGGFLKSGFAIFDMMQSSDPDLGLHTIGLGLVASTASLILCGGDQNYRATFEHTRVMIHQPTGEFRPKSEQKKEKEKEKKKEKKNPKLPIGNRAYDLNSYVDELLDLRQRVIDIYALTTKKDADVISRDIERDFFMSAEDAHAYGLIDRVLINSKIESDEDEDEESGVPLYHNLIREDRLVFREGSPLSREDSPDDAYSNDLQAKEDMDKEDLEYEERKKKKDLEEKEMDEKEGR